MAAPLKTDIVTFLKTNAAVNKLNFALTPDLRVWPDGYKTAVASAISKEDIKVHPVGGSAPAAGATYYPDFDSLDVSPSFSTASWRDQAFLVHECTHAYLDVLDLGSISNHENEALAYLAEAVFLEASGKPPLSTDTIRLVSHRIAKGILAGTYWVSSADAADLVKEVKTNPLYKSKVFYQSDGFNRRSVLKSLFR
jgi:hypothetical protein